MLQVHDVMTLKDALMSSCWQAGFIGVLHA